MSDRRRTADRPWLPEETPTERDVVDAGPYLLIPSSNNDACTQRIFVFVT
jgi:hypothetical protein